jgi:serine phosphatase RsbU (regulator of sigma subunit)
MASLVAIRGPSTGKDFPLGDECVLGRSLGCDIYIGDLNASRRHARILAVDGQHEVEDLGSGNGTFVNDQPVSRHRLSADDVIRIGASAFRYQVEQRRQWSDDVLTVMADAVQISQLGMPRAGSNTIAPRSADASAPGEVKPPSGLTEDRARQMLEVMYAIADVIATELDLPKLLEKLLDYLFEVFPQADRGFILLVNPATGELVPEAIKQRSSSAAGLQFSRTMVNQVMMTGEGVIRGRTLPPGQDLAALNQPVGEPQMGAPLICRGESLGTIHLEARAGSHSFTQHGLELLQAIALQAAVAIAAARAGQQLLSQQRLDDDLRTARQIQRNFLPRRIEQVQGLRFETYYGPANQIGGDFFDIIQISPTQVGILIGDISGHGIAAALLMAKVATDIRIAARAKTGAGEVLTEANQALVESGNEAMFATALYIVVDIAAQTLALANAGHQPPLVVSDRFQGVAELEDPSAVALGVLPGTEYPVRVYELKPGDVVLLYTDGINEAMNRQGHDYGMDRLRSVVAQPPCDPASLVQRVVADQRRFVGGAAQNDDQTVVAFGILPPLARQPSRSR